MWFFHCHIDWHLASGLAATMIEAPLELQETQSIPQDHLEVCRAIGTPSEGNAAGNTVDLFDLKGQNASPAPLPAGFTARGIVALVLSCVGAFIGMGVIAWYVFCTAVTDLWITAAPHTNVAVAGMALLRSAKQSLLLRKDSYRSTAATTK